MYDIYENDPLGFNQRTKSLLIGLGHEELVELAKEKNLSTDDLYKLTVNDLIVLGVAEDRVNDVHKSLKKLSKKYSNIEWTPEYKFSHLIDILRDGQRHLVLIRAYLRFCKHNLINERNKEIDNDAHISRALHLASKFAKKEFDFVKNELNRLKCEIIKEKQSEKSGYGKLCILVSTLGLTGSIIFYIYKR